MYIAGIDVKARNQLLEKQRRSKTSWVSSNAKSNTIKESTRVSRNENKICNTNRKQQAKSTNNQTNIAKVAETIVRYGISPIAGAAIATSTLESYGIVSKEKVSDVIDRSKVRRAIQEVGKRLNKNNNTITVKRVYFDGRKDKTKTYDDNRIKTIVEEHISMIKEPDSVYLGHVTPISGIHDIE